MIATPKWSFQIPAGMVVMGGIGFAVGRLVQVNEKLSIAVLAIYSLANDILFLAAKHTIRQPLHISSQALYVGTNTLVSTITIFTARHLDLISRRVTCALFFANSLILASRLSMLYTK